MPNLLIKYSITLDNSNNSNESPISIKKENLPKKAKVVNGASTTLSVDKAGRDSVRVIKLRK